jgi:CPA1 family monovalent cation:H+ antiporter
MPSAGVFILLFVVATAVAIAARRLHIPYTVALVLAGLLLGALHVFEVPHLTKELLFTVFLPGLLFEAAFHMEFEEFWRNRTAITALAVPGVVAAIALTAVILTPAINHFHFEAGFTWRHALVFGALIAATDPVAVVALFKSLGAPKRLTLLLEGESLLNDGTAIVLFTLVLGVLAGNGISARTMTIDFATVVGAGAVVGAIVGFGVSQIIKRIDDPMIEITLTTIAAYGAFVVAEQLQYSGVIATVTAGMLCGNYAVRVGMSASTRAAVETFWEYVAFALNSLVFLLIGFEVRAAALLASWPVILVAYLAVTAGRVLVVIAVSALLRMTRESVSRRWSAILIWGGLRGGVCMVLVLGLPHALPHRPLLVTMTFGVVILSILGQGLTMAPLLRRLGLVEDRAARTAYELARGRAQAATAALGALDGLARTQFAPPDVLDTLRGEYEEKVGRAQAEMHEVHLEREALRSEEWHRARRQLLLAERAQILDAYHQGVLSPQVYEQLVADVDAQLLRLESGEDRYPARPTGDDGGSAEAPSGSRVGSGSSPSASHNTSGRETAGPPANSTSDHLFGKD